MNTRSNHHLSEKIIEEGTSKELAGVLQPYIFCSQPKFCIDFDQGTHLVIRQIKMEKQSSKIKNTAKLISTITHRHISEEIIKEGTSW